MTIEGDYTLFAHLETVYLGVLARRTLVTTNVVDVLQAAKSKPSSSCLRAPRPLARPDGRRLRRLPRGPGLRGVDRRHDRRAGVVVGRQGRRHGAALAHRGVRRGHGARGQEVRRLGSAGPQRHRARRLRQQLGRDGARGRARARAAPLGRAARHLESLVDASLWHEMGDFKPTGVNERLVRKVRRRSTRRASSTSASSPRAASPPRRSAPSRSRTCRWTPTASARRSSAARTTSRPTWSRRTASRRRRSAGAYGRTSAWSA